MPNYNDKYNSRQGRNTVTNRNSDFENRGGDNYAYWENRGAQGYHTGNQGFYENSYPEYSTGDTYGMQEGNRDQRQNQPATWSYEHALNTNTRNSAFPHYGPQERVSNRQSGHIGDRDDYRSMQDNSRTGRGNRDQSYRNYNDPNYEKHRGYRSHVISGDEGYEGPVFGNSPMGLSERYDYDTEGNNSNNYRRNRNQPQQHNDNESFMERASDWIRDAWGNIIGRNDDNDRNGQNDYRSYNNQQAGNGRRDTEQWQDLHYNRGNNHNYRDENRDNGRRNNNNANSYNNQRINRGGWDDYNPGYRR